MKKVRHACESRGFDGRQKNYSKTSFLLKKGRKIVFDFFSSRVRDNQPGGVVVGQKVQRTTDRELDPQPGTPAYELRLLVCGSPHGAGRCLW